MYSQGRNELIPRINWSAEYWMNNRWKDRKRDLEWLIDKFWPVPTWPENWKELKNGNA